VATTGKVETKVDGRRRHKLRKLRPDVGRQHAWYGKKHTQNNQGVEHPYAPTGEIKHRLGPNELEKRILGSTERLFNPSD
jgi:hypothetical protein